MKLVCEQNACTACKACTNACPKACIKIEDTIDSINAVIDTQLCIDCGLCKRCCPNVNVRRLHAPYFWKQGWAEEPIRHASSSGGVATALIRAFIKSGGYVASCGFVDGDFRFIVTNELDKTYVFAGSKYVKSNPDNVYKEIKLLLARGEKVLFIGLPCQSAAVQNFCDNDESLLTIDLICHGTPSIQILKKYVSELGIDWNTIDDIQFRESEYFGLSINGDRIVPRRIKDSYILAFLNSLDYTENCYSCRYATLNRVSDITLGDAWGQLSEVESGGVSLVLCQTLKGKTIVESIGLHLEDVDLEEAVNANHQLRHPSVKCPERERFL